jgi:hypothetical protein
MSMSEFMSYSLRQFPSWNCEEGFDTIMYYEDEEDWENAIITDLDGNETSDDFVFIHILGDGAYDSVEDNSYLEIEPNNNTLLYSDELAACLNSLESDNIFVLITSCYAGGFEDDCNAIGRFIITESNSTTVAYGIDNLPAEGVFSHYFYNLLDLDYSATDAYQSANVLTQDWYEEEIEPEPYPTDQGPQVPMMNDRVSYIWFKWW